MINTNQAEMLCDAVKAVRTAVHSVLLWFVGLPAEAVKTHRMDIQMLYTGAGFLMVTWYVFMLIIWGKTGNHFFGTSGLIAFCLVPTIILAMDRLIIRQFRSPGGELAAYAVPELKPKRWEFVLRVFVAVSFSAVTTQTFLVERAQADIRAKQLQDQQLANEPLRREIAARIETQAVERMRTIKARVAELQAQEVILKEDHTKARQVAEESESRARGAQFNVAAEIGGIEGRARGAGPRYEAYALVARQSQDAAVNARAREDRARAALAKVQTELRQLDAERERATSVQTEALANMDAAMQEDSRYVSRKKGMFADATTLIRLYGDKDVGPGLVFNCLLAAVFLLGLELAPMLGLAFLQTTPLDVDRVSQNRRDAGRIVAEHEIDLMRSASHRTVHVRPITPDDRAEAGIVPPVDNKERDAQ